ncbi:hypothetical protein GCM10027419_32950 [Pandoraea terrae]
MKWVIRTVDDVETLNPFLSSLPPDMTLGELVAKAHMRWCIERDYQDLKQDLGLGHYEGRGGHGCHYHVVLGIAACGLLVAERIAAIWMLMIARRKVKPATPILSTHGYHACRASDLSTTRKGPRSLC